MRKPFFISLGIHIGLIFLLYVAALFSSPMKPPQKIYSVRILAAPQPEPKKESTKVEQPEKEQKPKPQKPKPKVIKKVTKKSKKKKPKPKPESSRRRQTSKTLAQGTASVQIEGKNFTDDFYLNLIITKIANNWLNPLRGGRKISAVVYFRIQRDGTVTDIKLEKSSGNSLFDQSALRAVMAASPLPALPESYTGDFLGVHFMFEHTGF